LVEAYLQTSYRLERKKGSFRYSNRTLVLKGRSIALFHTNNEIDIRNTKGKLKENVNELTERKHVGRRKSLSDWVANSFYTEDALEFLLIYLVNKLLLP